MKLITYILLMPRVRINGVISSLSPVHFWLAYRKPYLYLHEKYCFHSQFSVINSEPYPCADLFLKILVS